MVALLIVSLFVGRFPLSLTQILKGNVLHRNVFVNLRLSRALVGLVGGFALGVAGYVYQTIFKNPLAAPDIIGVSSGASAGAAAGILFLGSSLSILVSAFAGAILAVSLAITLSAFDRSGKKSTIVLAGIAVHSIAQTVLMTFKLIADPEKELASIEYWIMGSLNGISMHNIRFNIIMCLLCLVALWILHRQILLLATGEDESRMMGVNVLRLRILVLMLATLVVTCIISLTGIISFVGLIAPHCARKLSGSNDRRTMLLTGLIGGCVLLLADILARSVAQTELPVSVFTSVIGAPFLIAMIYRRRNRV